MHTNKLIATALFAAAATFLSSAAQAGDVRAGFIGWVPPTMGLTVNFTTPMPNANYVVTVQQTNTAGYSTTKDCTYFNVLHLTPNGFDIQHKRCDDGVPVPTDVSITMGWIAVSVQP